MIYHPALDAGSIITIKNLYPKQKHIYKETIIHFYI